MKTKTWYRVSQFGNVSASAAVAWTDTTITVSSFDWCVGCNQSYNTYPIRSTDNLNFFQTLQEAIEHSHKVIGNKNNLQGKLAWA